MYSNILSAKTAIVTGAGQGIGFEICRQLTKCGASVVLNDLDFKLATQAAELIDSEEVGRCLAYAGDSGDPELINDLVLFAVEKFGSVDIVVANAGITLFREFLAFTPETFNEVLRVNLQGTFFLAQIAAKQMVKQQKGGTILFTSSVTGHLAHKNLSVYGMTKAGIEMLAKCLVIELSSHGITVNSVVPGATKTERTVADDKYESTWAAVIPTGRVAEPLDIANAALFLVSPAARHITGQNLVVDGGVTSISISPF